MCLPGSATLIPAVHSDRIALRSAQASGDRGLWNWPAGRSDLPPGHHPGGHGERGQSDHGHQRLDQRGPAPAAPWLTKARWASTVLELFSKYNTGIPRRWPR